MRYDGRLHGGRALGRRPALERGEGRRAEARDVELGSPGVQASAILLAPDQSCTACCFADFDCSGSVGAFDLLTLLASWGPCAGCPEDLDGDGAVDFDDLLAVLTAWGTCP